MRVHYYRDPAGNFGDDLNRWLWPKLLPFGLDDDDRVLLVGIGTILNATIPAEPFKVVFGSGAGYGRRPTLDARWDVLCVRGPRTAAALGLSADVAVTDPAVLVREFLEATPRRSGVGFMPHHVSCTRSAIAGISLPDICAESGVRYLDPRDDCEAVFRGIGECDLILSEAMHGCIVADALRVPWIPVALYDHVLDFKWRDWCESLELDYRPVHLSPGPDLSASIIAAARAMPHLSDDRVLSDRIERLHAQLDILRRRYVTSTTPSWWHEPPLSLAERTAHESADTMYRTMEVVASLVAPGVTAVLVDDQQIPIRDPSLRGRCIPFTERDGEYWGPPTDAAAAIEDVQRARARGASVVIFTSATRWYLDAYPAFAAYLRATARIVRDDGILTVFEVRP